MTLLSIDNPVPKEGQAVDASTDGVFLRLTDNRGRGSFDLQALWNNLDALDEMAAGVRDARRAFLAQLPAEPAPVTVLAQDDDIVHDGRRLTVVSITINTAEVCVYVFDPDLATPEDLRAHFQHPSACRVLRVPPGTEFQVLTPMSLHAIR